MAVDPGLALGPAGARAAGDDAFEIAIGDDLVIMVFHKPREPLGEMELVQRDDAAQFRLDPVEARIIRALRHGEDAGRIGPQQDLGRDGEVLAHAHDFFLPMTFSRP